MCDLSQFEIDFPNEYIFEIVADMAKVMNIQTDIEKIKKTMNNDGRFNSHNLCIFRDSNDRENFIYLNCCNADFLYTIVIRCRREIAKTVKSKLLEWDKEVRVIYGQEVFDDLDDVIDVENNMLNETLRLNKVNSLDEIK